MQLGQQNLHVGPSERLPATPVHAVAGDELPLAQQPLDEQNRWAIELQLTARTDEDT